MVEQPKNKILNLLSKDSVRRRHSCIRKRAWRKKCVLVPISLRKLRIYHNMGSSQWRPMYWCGDYSCHRQWKQSFILARSILRIWNLQEHRLREDPEFIWYHSQVDIRPSWRDSGCETNWEHSSLMDEIYVVSWSSDQVDKSNSICLFRLRSMPGEDVGSFRSKPKMGRPSSRFSIIRFLRRVAGNRWRNNLVRLKYSPRTYIIADSSKDPEWFAKTEYWTRKIWASYHLQFHVQWHWSDSEGNSENCISNQAKSRCTRRGSRKDIGRSLVLETKRCSIETEITNLKENGIPLPHSWHYEPKNHVTQSLQVPVHRVVEFWKD